MLKVYIDTGGMLQVVRDLEAEGLIQTFYYPFEQRNKRVSTVVPGAGATWAQSRLSWKEEPGSWKDYEHSEQAKAIRSIVQQPVDTQHLDTAFKAGCSVFLTSDKGDICARRDQLKELLDLTVFHMPTEAALFEAMVRASGAILP